eukprot:m.449074 g.449074  ORF g.449074 m.449074 type:complete len:75 (-) comp19762_c0_seq1:813-1037(-)
MASIGYHGTSGVGYITKHPGCPGTEPGIMGMPFGPSSKPNFFMISSGGEPSALIFSINSMTFFDCAAVAMLESS